MTGLDTTLRQATALLGAVAGADLSTLSDTQVCSLVSAVEAAGRLVDAARVRVAAEVADRSRPELGAEGLSARNGFRKPIGLLEHLTRVSVTELRGRVRVGDAIRPRPGLTGEVLPARFPVLAESVVAGGIDIDSAATIITHLDLASAGSQASVENLAAAETALVELANREPSEVVRMVAVQWRCALDPDGVEPDYDEIRSRRGLVKGRLRNGITPWRINADPETSALIDAVLADAMVPGAVPRFLPGTNSDSVAGAPAAAPASRANSLDLPGPAPVGLVADDDGRERELPADTRTRVQKQLDMLVGVLTAGMRASHDAPPPMRSATQVMATVTLAELDAGVGVGWLAGVGVPVPVSAIRRMVCDAGLRVSILGDGGIPLFEAVKSRYFTSAQRRGMMIRDGDRCCGPGCDSPASWCDGHHVRFWSTGGPTAVDNGVLLCGSCHTGLHAGLFQLRMTDGHPYWRLTIDSHDPTAWRRAGQPPTTRLTA